MTGKAGSVPEQMLYDGEFDLTFLRDGETVGSTGDGDGSCWVQQPTGPGTANGMRLNKGDVLARNECGTLYAYTPSPEPVYEYGLQRREAGRWRDCGSGPGSLGTARADFRGWRSTAPEVHLRIVRREVKPWTVTDQSYTAQSGSSVPPEVTR